MIPVSIKFKLFSDKLRLLVFGVFFLTAGHCLSFAESTPPDVFQLVPPERSLKTVHQFIVIDDFNGGQFLKREGATWRTKATNIGALEIGIDETQDVAELGTAGDVPRIVDLSQSIAEYSPLVRVAPILANGRNQGLGQPGVRIPRGDAGTECRTRRGGHCAGPSGSLSVGGWGSGSDDAPSRSRIAWRGIRTSRPILKCSNSPSATSRRIKRSEQPRVRDASLTSSAHELAAIG